jgi:hypothetical protein
VSWRARHEVLTEGSLHMHYTSSIYNLASFFKGLKAIFKEVEILSLLQPVGVHHNQI